MYPYLRTLELCSRQPVDPNPSGGKARMVLDDDVLWEEFIYISVLALEKNKIGILNIYKWGLSGIVSSG